MRSNWLRDRLTEAKQKSVMWTELADSIQAIFEQQVEPVINRLRSMNSTFSMTEEDLKKRVTELGEFFVISERVPIEDWPLALMQRQDEIRLKRTDYPLKSTINREFSGLQIEWLPLYAPLDQTAWPYGSRFTTTEQMPFEDLPENEWFMTARGVIMLPITELTKAFPDSKTVDEQTALFEAALSRLIEPMIPLHIVYDGTRYYMTYTLPEFEEIYAPVAYEIAQTMPAAIEGHEHQVVGVDTPTDYMPVMNNGCAYRYNYQPRMDAYSLDAWTLDRPLPSG